VQVALEQNSLESRSLNSPYSAVNLMTAGAFGAGILLHQVDVTCPNWQISFVT
jgi:hypothetical protein